MMKIELYKDCDKILRNLFSETDEKIIKVFREVYAKERIDPFKANICLLFIIKRNYVEIISNGDQSVDSEQIALTKKGRLFIRNTSLVQELRKKTKL